MYVGACVILQFTITLLIAFKLNALYGQLTDFMLHATLPTEKTRRRHNRWAIAVWVCCMADWCFYIVVNVIYTQNEDF